MQTVNIHEAKTHLSRLLESVAAGQEIIVAKAGKPMARLSPIGKHPVASLRLGVLKGKVTMAEDFDAPLPVGALAAFEGP
ncbi:MAG: type II toxin-antitoxin system Phd/YefM family antitoxin [Nitrospirota bacterium]|jgi:prevent-host-death family protein